MPIKLRYKTDKSHTHIWAIKYYVVKHTEFYPGLARYAVNLSRFIK